MQNILYFILLIISLFISVFVFFTAKKYNGSNKERKNIMMLLPLTTFIWSLSLIFQISLEHTGIPLTIFEGFASFGACFLPILILFLGITFSKKQFKFKWYYLFLFIIPVISTFLMFNDTKYHLFYEHYSTNLNETIYGPYMPIHSTFSYVCIITGLLLLLYNSIRKAGFFSRQSLLIIIGTLVPTIANLLSYAGLIKATVYLTPITFSIGLSFYTVAIFKFKFLSVAPIALQQIVDRMSDGFLVLNENNTIIDCNKTFLTLFYTSEKNVINTNIYDLLYKFKIEKNDLDTFKTLLDKSKKSDLTYTLKTKLPNIDKTFNIEINSIKTKNDLIGSLILLKDETQHIKDLDIIKSNQELLMEKERLASLGQLIGGIAHNLKTPIMSIGGAAEGLTDLVKEYDSSIEDSNVTFEDHHEIASDMTEWIEKIKTHTSYMSDIITAVKGQAVTLSANSEDLNEFTIEELVKRVNILMKHELKAALTDLTIDIKINTETILKGNVNSLVQVINNMISNSIQSYNGNPNQNINLNIFKEKNNIIIQIVDYGCGMTNEVKKKLFKEMITTKGKNGTGLGMFMSYSTIRGNFNGNITFTSAENKGTTFNIILPIK